MIHTESRTGPKMEPWGTKQGRETWSPIETKHQWFERLDSGLLDRLKPDRVCVLCFQADRNGLRVHHGESWQHGSPRCPHLGRGDITDPNLVNKPKC